MRISKISILSLAIIIFASFNPKDVQAATYEPPKVYNDGIVSTFIEPRALALKIEYVDKAVVAEKTVYVAPVAVVAPPQVHTPITKDNPLKRGLANGNSYSPGYCTYYAKQRRPDLPNNLGNANTWYQRAVAQGIPVGSEPRVGAIGEAKTYMHVVYIEAVNGNTVTVSEMNYKGRGVVSTRTAPASEFRYIY